MKKISLYIFGIIYIIITAVMTIFLLSKNEYNVTEINDNTYYIVTKKNLKYNKGDLLLIKNESPNKIETDKYIFYYNTYAKNMQVDIAKIVEVEKITETETTYLLDNDAYISSEYVIGSTDTVKIVPLVGYIIMVLESTWGYLLFIVLPLFILFLLEMRSIIKETRKK